MCLGQKQIKTIQAKCCMQRTYIFFNSFIYFIKNPEFDEMGTTYTYNDTDNIITHMNT